MRFHHGAQGYCLDELLLFFPFHLVEQFVQASCRFLLVSLGAQLVAESRDEGTQVFEFCLVGRVVHTVGEYLGFLSLWYAANHFGYAAVGQEHELFDEFVGVFCHLYVCGYWVSLVVDFKAHLGAVEAYRAVCKTLCAQDFGQAVERYKLFGVFAHRLAVGTFYRFGVVSRQSEVFGRGFAILLQYVLHFLVCKPAVAAYHGVRKVPVVNFSLFVHAENGTVRQFFLVGAQGADKVAEPFGQHGDSAVHEVNARCPAAGFLVYYVALVYVVRHVGYVDAYFPKAACCAANGKRVVKVLGVVRVYGKGCNVSEIFAACYLFGRYVGRKFVGCVFRIAVRQVEFCENGVHFRVVLARASEYVDYFSHGILCSVGPFDYFHHGFVAGYASFQVCLGYENVV